MVFVIFLLATTVAMASCEADPGQGLYKRILVTSQVWPRLVNKVAPTNYLSPVDCVGLCRLELNSCSVSFHDELLELCLLGDLSGNFSIARFQNRSLYGYASMGKD